MTIASTLTKKQYLGNGVTREFPVPFFAADKSHVFAMLRTETGVTEIKDNFEVDLTRNVFVYPKSGEALKTGQSITVFRKVPLTQIVDLENAGAFHPEVLERDGFDRIVMQIQQLDEAISRALKIDITDNRDVSDLVEQLFFARDEAVKQAENAKLQAEASAEQARQSADSAEESGTYAELSKAWAESGTNPDSADSQSKSSKSWALYAEEKLGELTALRVDCKISNSGVGEVKYSKEENLLEIILPFDNSGSEQPKVILTDEISLNRSDISASAKAVSLLNAKCASDLFKQVQTINTALGKKLDKTAVVNSLTSTVTTSALSAAQGKVLNDKIAAVFNGIVKLKGTRTATGTWTLTGLTAGKPVFLVSEAIKEAGENVAVYYATAGVVGTNATIGYQIGTVASPKLTPAAVLIPSSSTVSLNFTVMNNIKVYAYQ